MNSSLPTEDNGIIFSKGITKISADDKAAVPVGEPDLPVRTNVKKINKSMVLCESKTKPTALDHDFHKANIRPSVALIIKTLTHECS